VRAARAWALAIAAVSVAALVLTVASSRQKKRTPPAATEAAPDDDDAWRYETRTFVMPLDRYDVRIDDVGMTTDLEGVLRKAGGEVAVNGGFFDKANRALGLAISGGKQLSPLARSLSGGVLVSDGERARLFETESFSLSTEDRERTRFAIQCRPRLVVGGAPNVKSDDGKRSERTALCLREGGRTIEIVLAHARDNESSGPSLFLFARWLAGHGCEDALNLDGGPSTGAAWREDGQIRSMPPRGPVRHAVIFVKREG
jgi:uncharacterized protein YigE (DUF2233 family)